MSAVGLGVSRAAARRMRRRLLPMFAAGAGAAFLAWGGSGALASGGPCGSYGVYSASGASASCAYSKQGYEDTFAVPAGVATLNVLAVGAPGGEGFGSAGGFGADVTNAALPVSPREALWVDVGQAGPSSSYIGASCSAGGLFDGGPGSSLSYTGPHCGQYGGGGGGSSAILTSPRASATLTGDAATDSRLLVAGGGGGGGDTDTSATGGNAGDATTGGASANGVGAGAGGCGSNGGPGGVGPTDGTSGDGPGGGCGIATAGTAQGGGTGFYGGGGGGGGGWFGGGGGGSYAGGGGGSSYGGAGNGTVSIATASSTQQPEVVITWTIPPIATSLTAAPQLVSFGPSHGIGLGMVSATLRSGDNPLAEQTITFTVGSHTLCAPTTNSSGVASCRLSLLDELQVLAANGYRATFAGNPPYLSSTAATAAVKIQ